MGQRREFLCKRLLDILKKKLLNDILFPFVGEVQSHAESFNKRIGEVIRYKHTSHSFMSISEISVQKEKPKTTINQQKNE